MLESIFYYLSLAEDIFWGYIAFFFILVVGFALSFKAGFFQIRTLPRIFKIFIECLKAKDEERRGIHPIRAFFTCAGGMIGIGNVVGIVTAVQIGGPGALVWVWVAGTIGAVVKYSEIYLGFKYRVENQEGGYDGGPMYFLRKAFNNKILPCAVAFLLCIYGAEIYQFSVIADSVSTNWHVPRPLAICFLLGAVIYAGLGGIKRIGKICSRIMPFFHIIYLSIAVWVVAHEAHALPGLLMEIFRSAFTGHAAVGGFAGAGVFLVIQSGIARAAYSSDIGIGYDSIIQSETSTSLPERQGRLAILGVLVDNTICSLSILIVLLSGVWKADPVLPGSLLVQTGLSQYFPYMHYFMPLFFIITGYTAIIAYFAVGIKCAKYLTPNFGKKIYVVYATAAFIFFSFVPQHYALLVMSVSGALLLISNLWGVFRLRHEIIFAEDPSSKVFRIKDPV